MFRRFVCVRQNDQSDCGAAALATIALHHKVPVVLQQLRDQAGTDRIGTNLLGLVSAAEQLGFVAKGVKAGYDALIGLPLPAIAHTVNEDGLGHFVVLHRVNSRSVVLADPGKGIERTSRDEFCQRWSGCLLIVTPDETKQLKASSHGPIAPLRRLIGLLLCHRAILIEAFCCAMVMTLLGIATSFFVQHLVDSVLTRSESTLLNALGIGMVLVVVFRTLFGVVRSYLLAHMTRKIDLTLVSSYARHILQLPMRFFEMRRVGEILSRINDAAKVRQAISGTALTAAVDGVMVLLSLAVLWLYDVPLAAVATAFVPLLLLSAAVHHPSIKRRSREAMEQQARLSAHLVEDISGVETIKAFGQERVRAEEGESRLVRIVQSVFSLQMLGISMSSAGTFVTGLAGIVILWVGGHRVMQGVLTVGQLMFFHTLLGYMLGPLERLANINMQLQDALVAIDRLFQIMDLEIEPTQDEGKSQLHGVREAIHFDRVSFQYGCREKVLRDVDLRIPAGSTVAIVGESGSGKSTLLKLLMRLHDPSEGSIRVDGVDVRDISVASMRSKIGAVSQEPFVFTGTIRDNISVGRPDATMDQIVHVARAAGLDEFIAKLPDRFDTVIGERGANLSGGQRQRLAIARALLQDPEILIFDEATSHLDIATELAIQRNLTTLLAHKTVVLVAHRLSTVQHADVIFLLKDGEVAEQGRHGELMKQGGIYASLWRAQSAAEATRVPLARPNGSPSLGIQTAQLQRRTETCATI